MYQALYRKYRPNSFNEVVGQNIVVKTLTNSIKNNTINHAYLFTGPRGTGKTSIAKILAKTINCTNLNESIACNVCVNCTQINDVIEIDAASNNGVDEIRELRNKVNIVPTLGKYKIYIIDEVHMLTTGAFNALLKTLEEPPQHVIFVLATTEPHKIPLTILSRCQRFDFKKIIANQISEKLKEISKKENININDESILEIARLSDGGLRDAIGMLDQLISYVDGNIEIKHIHEVNGTITQNDLKEIMQYVVDNNLSSIIQLINKYNDEGKNIIKLTEEIILYLRNVLLLVKTPSYFKNNELDEHIYEQIAKQLSVEKLYNIIKQLTLCINDIKLSNNPKINLELCFIKLIDIENNTNIEKEVPILDKKVKEIKNKEEKEIPLKDKGNDKDNDKDNINSIEATELIHLKEIRINNTLSNFKRKYVEEIVKNIELIKPLTLISEYSQVTPIILDGKIKAASDEHVVFVYQDKIMADMFNESILTIEKIIKKAYNKEYKVIATDNEEWEKIKQQFNDKTKTYKYIEEKIDLNQLLAKKANKKEDDIKNLFGEIVEYN